MHTALEKVREVLGGEGFPRCESASLRLEKFVRLGKDDSGKETKRQEIEAVVSKNQRSIPQPIPKGGIRFVAKLGGRLIVNQAGGILENAGLCLHRHFNAPYIPGSAVMLPRTLRKSSAIRRGILVLTISSRRIVVMTVTRRARSRFWTPFLRRQRVCPLIWSTAITANIMPASDLKRRIVNRRFRIFFPLLRRALGSRSPWFPAGPVMRSWTEHGISLCRQ